MASRKENLKSLFSNTKTRVIIIFTAAMMVVLISIGFVKLNKNLASQAGGQSDVSSAPGIQSIPGALNPTEQYQKLQQQQNLSQAQQATRTGQSAIPTLIKMQKFGQGIEAIGPQSGEGGLGFAGLQQKGQAGPGQSLWLQQLKGDNCSVASIKKVASQGATPIDIKQACDCIELKDAGYGLNELQTVCPCKQLKAAGFNARQLKEAGFSARQLRACGFDACQLKNAGFTAEQMKAGGFSDGELKGAGFDSRAIKVAGGLPEGIDVADVLKAGCNAPALQRLRQQGVSAAAIRRISGCTAAQLKAAGYSASALRDAGFTAAELKRAGFTAAQLKAAGFSARDLLNSGFLPAELKAAGFSDAQIKQAETQLPPGITPQQVKEAGCDVDALRKERIAGVSALAIKKYAGCSAAALKAAGFTDDDLKKAGFSPEQIKQAGSGLPPGVTPDFLKKVNCNDTKAINQLRKKGVSAAALKKDAGCNARQLMAAGYSNKDLAMAGFTPQEIATAQESLPPGLTPADIRNAGCGVDALKKLKARGVSAAQIKRYAGCSAVQLKAAGFTAAQLKAAGFSATELKNAGFSAAQLKAAGYVPDAVTRAGYTAGDTDLSLPQGVTVDALKKAGCNPTALAQLREKGVTAYQIKKINDCSAAALKAAGYSSSNLKNAGFSKSQLLNSGFTPNELEQAGFSPADILAAARITDCSLASLRAAKAAGVSAADIRKTLGCSAKQLKAAGYTAKELKDAGFTAAQLKDAGFSAAELKAAGFSAKQLKDAGFSASQLKDVGFSAAQLKAAGFNARQLKAAGYTAQELKDAGFSATQLKEGGFSPAQLKAAGFNAQQLKDAGFNARQLKDAGFSAQQLKNAGLSDPDSELASLGQAPRLGVGTSRLAGIPGAPRGEQDKMNKNAENLQKIMDRQNRQMAEQRYQSLIQQKTSAMRGLANQLMGDWAKVTTQYYAAGSNIDYGLGEQGKPTMAQGESKAGDTANGVQSFNQTPSKAMIKAGDILFAVLDTSVNSDEPGPILATIVSGKLKGTKLIGSFTLPSNSDKLVMSFNTMSMPSAASTFSINAYAVDPNTARTALASRTNHHYLMRYGSLFASSFLEGFGNAFQSANTTITVGGVGGTNDITVQNGVGRSAMENAVIALADVGKAWGQQVQTYMNRPTTVEVFSGTGLGILFTQDVAQIQKAKGE